MARKSTTENPAEQNEAGEEQVSPPAQEGSDEGSALARASRMPAGVKYIGDAHVREISAADWKNVGVDDQKKVVWDNRVRGKNIVLVSELSQEALEYLDRYDDGFVLVDENGKRV